MFMVLVKTTPHMTGSYSYMLPDETAAREFVQRPGIWWYHFSTAAEYGDWEWHKGGAWLAAQTVHETGAQPPAGPLPPRGLDLPAPREDESDDEEDRW